MALPANTDWTTTPLVSPPDGQHTNFVNPETRTPMAITVSSIVLVCSLIAIVLRFYARHFILGKIGPDDWVGLGAAFITLVYTIYSIWLFAGPGIGPHMWNIPGAVFLDPKYGLKLLFGQILYCPSAYLIKLSILLLYKRVFATPGGKARYFIDGGIYGFSLLYLVMFVLSWAFCVESQSLVDDGSCHTNGAYMTWSLAAVNVLTDMYILAIPPFVIAKLHIATRRKSAVTAVFLVSIFATVASVLSVYYRVVLAKDSVDFSWNSAAAGVSTIAELNVGVICSSMPAINIIFHKDMQQRYKATYGTGVSKSSRVWTRSRNRTVDEELSNDGTQSDRDIVKLIHITQHTTHPVKNSGLSTHSSR